MAATERTPLLDGRSLERVAAGDAQETQLTTANDDGQARRSNKSATAPVRQIAPDLLRGLLMILMAVDHANVSLHGYPHGTAASSEAASTPMYRWTNNLGYTLRTLSHLCAPGFTMLLGMGIAFFVASRPAWSPVHFVKHLLLRTLAILAVNAALTLLVISRGVWLFNIVLIALAVDYLLVGLLAIFCFFSLEPSLVRVWKSFIASHYEGDDRQSRIEQRAKSLAFHSINLLLLLLSFLTIWWNIWFDPLHGQCTSSSLHTFSAAQTPPKMVIAAFGDEANCTSDNLRLLFNFFFLPTTCRGILSGFPPLAWISFALFGLLYGRLLLVRLARRKQATPSSQADTPDIALESFFAVLFALLFVASRVWQFGNLSTNCLHTPDQQSAKHSSYLASFKAFLYIVKYPPSPAFGFFTLSGNFLLLALFNVLSSPASSVPIIIRALRSDRNPLLVFGRQPLFFYLFHLLISQLVGPLLVATRLAHDIPADEWDGHESMRGFGLGAWFFIFYFILLFLMYPLCQLYGRFKLRQPNESVWRFL